MPFIGELQYKKIEGKMSVFGRQVYKLTKPFEYMIGVDRGYNPYFTIKCEEGFETDFASIPWFIFFLNPKNGRWKSASVIHDKACKMADKKILTFKTADSIFYYAMLDDGSFKFVARFFYFWVRAHHLVSRKG
jgi:hypothetical protein